MRALVLATGVVGSMVALGSSASADATLGLVPARSHATFDVTHLFVQHVTGAVPITRGRVTFGPASAVVPTGVEATLDPAHVATGDADRDDDLHGPDWFDVARYPTWTFASTQIRPTPPGFAMNGTLTIHGVARPVTLDVVIVRASPHPRYRVTGKLDRHAFGMHVTPFDGTIGNDITLVLDVELDA